MRQPDATQSAPFPSLAALLAVHAELLQSMPEGRLAEPDVLKIRAFLRQAVASGALIDTPIERKQVQGLLDYWSATLYANGPERAGETTEATRLPISETVLTEFQPETIADIAAKAQAWLQSIAPTDRDLVRRMLLRLVRLSDASRTFLPIPTTRAELQQLGTPARVDALLNGLGDAVRIERRERPEDDRISLRFAALTRMWQAYADWLEQRLRFRDAASFWDASSRDSSALIRDELLNESLGYHDKNDIEEAYIVASLNREARTEHRGPQRKVHIRSRRGRRVAARRPVVLAVEYREPGPRGRGGSAAACGSRGQEGRRSREGSQKGRDRAQGEIQALQHGHRHPDPRAGRDEQ